MAANRSVPPASIPATRRRRRPRSRRLAKLVAGVLAATVVVGLGPTTAVASRPREKPGSQDPLAGAPAFNFLTGEGGFTQVFTNGLTGLRWRADRVHLDPMLPPQLGRGVVLKGLHWQGRTFDVSVGPDNTTVSATVGQPFTVESPQGSQLVSVGSPLSLKTRRPDLAPTDNLAQCRPGAGLRQRQRLGAGAARRPRRDAPTPGQRPLRPRRTHPGGERRDHRHPRAGGGPVGDVTRAGATA